MSNYSPSCAVRASQPWCWVCSCISNIGRGIGSVHVSQTWAVVLGLSMYLKHGPWCWVCPCISNMGRGVGSVMYLKHGPWCWVCPCICISNMGRSVGSVHVSQTWAVVLGLLRISNMGRGVGACYVSQTWAVVLGLSMYLKHRPWCWVYPCISNMGLESKAEFSVCKLAGSVLSVARCKFTPILP